MMNQIVVSSLTEADLEETARLEREVFADPWSMDSLRKSLCNPDYRMLKAEWDGRLAGYLGAYRMVDETAITNVAVFPEFQNKGIGRALLQQIEQWAVENKQLAVSLEVRPSNAGAVHLYEALGYQRVGIRKRYYEHPTEDGWIYRKLLNDIQW